jgi:hypothetical protein
MADDLQDRVVALRRDLRAAAERYVAIAADLGLIADELASLEAQVRAADHQAGIFHGPQPSPSELAAEVLHGRLGALRPYVPFVTLESADRAAEALMTLPDKGVSQ